ncbi:MAG TPA: TerB family tellurite resistance protein, partial [Telluria sp.]
MRSYALNSTHAAGRILALTMVVDGNLVPSELAALDRTRILNYVALDRDAFRQLLQDLCDDLLTGSVHGVVQFDAALFDNLLMEI